jgi:hypothetical protein
MYRWIWHHLPQPLWLRLLSATALIAGVVVVLFTWVFPVIEPWLNQPTLP